MNTKYLRTPGANFNGTSSESTGGGSGNGQLPQPNRHRKRTPLDVRALLQAHASFELGCFTARELHLSWRQYVDEHTGFYKPEAVLQLL